MNTPGPTDELSRLAADAVAALKERGLTVITAEATTGGLIGHLLTSVPGSSAVFRGGIAPCSNAMKRAIGVSADVLTEFGAVSQQAAEALAIAARAWADADIALAETGIAGPTGRRLGVFWIALADATGVRSETFTFDSDRIGNHQACAEAALQLLLQTLTRS